MIFALVNRKLRKSVNNTNNLIFSKILAFCCIFGPFIKFFVDKLSFFEALKYQGYIRFYKVKNHHTQFISLIL